MYKKYLVRITVYFFLIFTIDITLGFIIDPYMVFHKPWMHSEYYFKDMRKQAAGIINTHEFDSIILGTSMAQNSSSEEASSEFNANFVNLSIGGGFLSEREILLKYALDKKNIKNIIITLDVFGDYGQYRPDIPVNSYSYLYNESLLDDLKLYVGFKKIGYLFCGNLIFQYNCPFTVESLSKATEWYSDTVNSRRFGGVDNWIKYSNDPLIRDALKSIITTVENDPTPIDQIRISKVVHNDKNIFKDYVLHYIDENPETNFYLFFPPYHRIKHSLWQKYDPSQYIIYKKRIESVVTLLESHDNARVFGYDDFPFVDDISNYKDTRHYHPKYNSLILQWMKKGIGELKVDKLTNYFHKIDEKSSEYQLQNIINLIKSRLN
jgi:hypothetical protein